MIEITNNEMCCGCGACASACTQKCIELKTDTEGFYYPKVDVLKCINCGRCNSVCPFQNSISSQSISISYAAKSRDINNRLNSSSGGVFFHLAQEVIRKNGVVVGVALDYDCKIARHVWVEDEKQLNKLRGSKYLQAEPITLYNQIKQTLIDGRIVMFSGTPCQINALILFLNRRYENLYCIDIICHGVPSQTLWNSYLQNVEKNTGKIVEVNFRHKRNGWKEFGINKVNNKGYEYYSPKDKDPYMYFFLNNLSLRPSCYACKAKKEKLSDITLADFWSFDALPIGFDDGNGVSLIIQRTVKGGILIDRVSDKIDIVKVDIKDALRNNSVEYQSVNRPLERDTFYKDYVHLTFNELKKKYIKKNYSLQAKKIIKKMIKCVLGGGK